MVRGVVPRQPGKRGKQEGIKQQPRRAAVGVESRTLSRQSKPTGKPLPGTKAAKPAKAVKSARTHSSAYNPLAPERIAEILKRLDAAYPGATCALHHHNAWELLVATILSAQCTDVRVNMVTPELFKQYPTPRDLAAVSPEQIEPAIRSTGFFRNKSKSIVGAARKIVAEYGGEVPSDFEKLLSLPGVARKTANVVLGTWFGKAEGVVVDTHVQRIARRLELTRQDDPVRIEQDLMAVIPRERWILFAHQIILHGRALCTARRPQCADCPLENLCHAGDKTWSTVDIHQSATP